MKIVGHVDHVIDKRRNLGNRERLKIPIGSGKSNRDSLAALSNLVPHNLKERNVVGSIGRRTIRASGARILPVEINTIELVVVQNSHDVVSKLVTVRRLDSITVKLVS